MAINPVIKHYFDVLGLKPTTDKTAIKKAYMKKALVLHPDKCGNNTSEAAFKMIAQAWEVLSEHEMSPSDVQGDTHGVDDTGSHSADALQTLILERDCLKRTVNRQAGINSSQASQLEQQNMAYEALSDKHYILEHKLEQEENLSNDRFLALLDEHAAHAKLSREHKSLQRTVDWQADENRKQARQLSQQNSERQELKGKIAMQAVNYEERIVKSETETHLAERNIRMLEKQLDESLRFHDVLFFFSLVIIVFVVGNCIVSVS